MKKIEELLKELHAESDYAASEDFTADGLLDSFDFMRLIGLLETEYGVRVAGTDLVPMNFLNLGAIRKFLAGYGVEGEI